MQSQFIVSLYAMICIAKLIDVLNLSQKKMIISKDVRFDKLERGYPLLQPYPIEKNSKIVV